MDRRWSVESLEDQLRCPVCLEIFTEPLILQCGQSYCRGCVRAISVNPLGQLQCPVCRCAVDADCPPPNVALARIVDAVRTLNTPDKGPLEICAQHNNPLSLYCEEDRALICGLCGSIGAHRAHKVTPIHSVYSRMKEDISCLMTEFQTQGRKLEEQICKMDFNKSRITNESDVLKWVVRKEFGELRRCLELEEAGFMEKVENAASTLISSIQRQSEQMNQLLAKMQSAEATLDALSNDSHLEFIAKYGSIAPRLREGQQREQRDEKIYSSMQFNPGFSHNDIKMYVWKRLHRRVLPAPEHLKFDPLTAHPMLHLSKDSTKVECGVLLNRLPNNPERFSYSYCVLASRGFSSGKHYWEVQVGPKPKWRIGLIKGTASRKGKLFKSPENGVWLMGLREGRFYEAFTSPRVLLPLNSHPQRLGVFLDYESGQITFYNADSEDELGFIYSYQAELQGKVFPLFDVCWHERGANKLPLSLPQALTHR
ncbi:E3 ubiquitin-protein ligase TRIM50-like [Triplophysa dalaica]|uniref:E3 ubiquitin-protein ligase TRIM50-like n=1 Tax=Triplophysa dalaica TaxID=1582913 RepID=UPI0024E0311B|nr:E3 ubiquitin-protein ligase TRIM50-like [Triplophysa dalaica]